jgi:hypothetical protein
LTISRHLKPAACSSATTSGLTATKRHLLAFFAQSFPGDPASGFFRGAGTLPLEAGDLVESAK